MRVRSAGSDIYWRMNSVLRIRPRSRDFCDNETGPHRSPQAPRDTLTPPGTVIAGWSLFYFAKSTGWMVGGFPEGASMGDLFGEQSANGGLQLGLSLGFSIATVSIVYFGVQKGIERIARVFLPILFGILVLLLVSALRMDGAGEAIGFIFRPSFGELDGGSVLEVTP